MTRKQEANKEGSPVLATSPEPQVLDGHSSAPFPMVGIGASAGGLAAFQAFFTGLSTQGDPGMAFILVQHLAPDHESLLGELIRHYTRLQVLDIEDGMRVRPNCVYVIPPGRDLAFLDGSLQLLEPVAPHGQRLPIDFFFRSLAQDQRERAIGVVLSGTGSDGTQGVRAIKGEGGLVLAQNPESTEYDGMPRSAIATGLVDEVLPPADMAVWLLAHAASGFGKPGLRSTLAPTQVPGLENALKKMFVLLRSQTGHDFSQYKLSTIQRRIERRMAVHQVDTPEHYVKFLQQAPAEVEALFRDLLIGVTNFFRDTEAFRALEEQIIPKLFLDKPAGSAIRVWVPACSTGEEAYSIAILLQERIEALKQRYILQVFATDIDSQAVATARAGVYPATIASDLSPERLARFFVAEPDGNSYRIHKGIRDLLVFSEQNLVRDPPFSKLDLISCRNLLIYLGLDLQKRLIPLFHYALNPGGVLFLGTSETVGDAESLFHVLDRTSKLYQRLEDFHGTQKLGLGRVSPPTAFVALPPARVIVKRAVQVKLPLRELTEQALLQKATPAGALVNGQGEILYLHGRTGQFLEPTAGEVGPSNILKMAREGLRRELGVAFRSAMKARQAVLRPGLRVRTNGHYSRVNLGVHPLEAGLFLIVLEEVAPFVGPPTPPSSDRREHILDVDLRVLALKQELQLKEDNLQSTNEELESSNEELESSNEELKSSNEEMQSVNEELQSTNEELETSKEELQSVNEELATINHEMQSKVVDLSRANNDMNNLLAGTGIGTVFVDHHLCIMRFTPMASSIINLIQSDLGRPLSDLVSNLVGYDRLMDDIRVVLDSFIPKEVAVQSAEGRWYTMRIQPYRTLDNHIEGAVITFVDITETQRLREALEKANALVRMAVVVRDAHDAITVQDLEGRTLAWNPGAVRMYGWTEAEALKLNIRDRVPPGQREEALGKLRQLSQAKILAPYVAQRLDKAGAIVEISMTSTALVDEAGVMFAIATTERNLPPELAEVRDEP